MSVTKLSWVATTEHKNIIAPNVGEILIKTEKNKNAKQLPQDNRRAE